MGCDIHMYMEYRVGDGKWQADEHHKPYAKNCHNQSHTSTPCDACASNPTGECELYGPQRIYALSATGRFYALFAALAGVRGEGPDPLGVPDDASPEILKAAEEIGDDGHSHSYISLDDFEETCRKLSLYDEIGSGTTSTNAFYNVMKTDFQHRPRPFVTVVNYGKKLIADISAEEHLLGEKRPVQVRLVYWFDN